MLIVNMIFANDLIRYTEKTSINELNINLLIVNQCIFLFHT